MQPTLSSLRPLFGGLLLAFLAAGPDPATAQSTLPAPPPAAAPATTLWEPAAAPVAARGPVAGPPARWFRLDTTQLAARLATAPPETRPEAAITLDLPHPDGTLHRYALTRVPVLAPALAARYPRLRTFAGRALDEPAATVRLEYTPTGLHAELRGADGSVSTITGIESEPATPPTLYQSRAQAPVAFDCQALLPPDAPRSSGPAIHPRPRPRPTAGSCARCGWPWPPPTSS
ncbi:hypothetical protein [Hymenobacter aerophilus]|uniref:hypothetical protein n=1 Tax=Hymenobacter aerophilus TaxID=119644 RepID=UPI0003A0D5D9|nr:hypothetical protein [Hymenobacter aerophilus]